MLIASADVLACAPQPRMPWGLKTPIMPSTCRIEDARGADLWRECWDVECGDDSVAPGTSPEWTTLDEGPGGVTAGVCPFATAFAASAVEAPATGRPSPARACSAYGVASRRQVSSTAGRLQNAKAAELPLTYHCRRRASGDALGAQHVSDDFTCHRAGRRVAMLQCATRLPSRRPCSQVGHHVPDGMQVGRSPALQAWCRAPRAEHRVEKCRDRQDASNAWIAEFRAGFFFDAPECGISSLRQTCHEITFAPQEQRLCQWIRRAVRH